MHLLPLASLLVHTPHTYADQSNAPLLVLGLFILMLIAPCLMAFETISREEEA